MVTACEPWLNSLMISATEFQQGVGTRLRQLREAMGKSQDAMGDKLGVGGTAIANYEKGDRALDPYHALKLKMIFGAPLEWLYGADESVIPPALAEKLENAAQARRKGRRTPPAAALSKLGKVARRA